jgi:hypothetical protein
MRRKNQSEWIRVTPIPLEFSDFGYLFKCSRCKKVITYLGGNDYPPFKCNSEEENDSSNL